MMADYTYQWCNTCDDCTVWRHPDINTPNDVFECTKCENLHVWRRSTFGTNTICDRCGLLPLDQDDIKSNCGA